MIKAGQDIIQELSVQLSLHNIEYDKLTALLANHPYFAFGQLLLAQQEQATSDIKANTQWKKTALYFNDTLWLQYLVNPEGRLIDQPEEVKNLPEENIATAAIQENAAASIIEATNTATKEEPEVIVETAIVPAQEVITDTRIEAEQLEPEIANEPELQVEKVVPEQNVEVIAVVEPAEESVPDTVLHTEIEAPQTKIELLIEPALVNEVIQPDNQPQEVTGQVDEDDLPLDEPEPQGELSVELSDHLSKLVEQQLQEFQKSINAEAPVADKPNPFHTIDYFASQGIKLLQGAQQQDQLANKVKSFTEWLKQMKRINQQPTDLGTDADTERIIENIAQTSNETKEVITETMAQVLAKQGKTAKAIQLYQKLSFLDPSKNIYFAAKIQELKDK